MAGGKGAHGTSRFLRRLRMKRALGIQSSRAMCPTSRTRGRDRRRGTWLNLKDNCIAIEGVDFAQDTQEGGADQFVLIPDSDEEGVDKGPSLLGSDDEFVPETEPQDIVVVNKIGGPCNNQCRPRLSTMLHDWKRIVEEEQQCARQIAPKEQKELTACFEEEKEHKGSDKEDKERKDNLKVEKEHDDNSMHQKASISDMETDDEASWVEDGVDLRGHSQVEDDSWMQDDNGSHICSQVEGDDFKDKVNELIIALFPAYRDVLRNAKR